VFLASGTGFAPLKALIEHMQHCGITRPTTLYWGGRRPGDLYMHDWVQAQLAVMPHLQYVPVVSDALPEDDWTGRTGFVHLAVLQDFADLSGYQVYACGAPVVVDAARRDFTMNALYADVSGALFDPSGTGIEDARTGRLVFVGDPKTRIDEDYLRILRYFRFLAWYGKGEPDRDALAACETGRARLADCSAERVAKEMLKLLAADDPRPALRLMASTGVLAQVLPQAEGLAVLDRLVAIEDEQLFENEPLLRLAALLPADPAAGDAMGRALRLSNEQRERLAQALGSDPRLVSWMSPKAARQVVYRLGNAVFRDRVKLHWARSLRPATTPQWRGLLALGESWRAPVMPISGKDVVGSGVPAGPLVGEVLREVEDWWVDSDFIDDKLSLVERLKSVAQGLAF
jgi:poly(A) polymerase